MPKNQHTFTLSLGSGQTGEDRRKRYEQAAEAEGLSTTKWLQRLGDSAAAAAERALKRIKGE